MPPIIDTVLTLALALIMFSLGLSLGQRDFRQVLAAPKSFLVGMTGQLIMLPLLAVGLVLLLQPPTPIALGMLVLAIAPGGATSAFMTNLFRGNVALSISLTALCGFVVIVTTPFLLSLLMPLVSDSGLTLRVPPSEIVRSLLRIVAGPVIVGMLLRAWFPRFTDLIERPIKITAATLFFALLIGAIVSQIDLVQDYFVAAGLFTITFNIAVVLSAFVLAKLSGLSARDGMAIVFECGMQNAPLAMFLAVSVMQQPDLSIAPAIYGVLQAPITLSLGYLVHKFGYRRS